eukprot:15430461-Alexandrium_andersonii.AAC.1
MKSHLAEPDHDHPTKIALTKMIPWEDTLWWKCVQGLGSQEDPSNRTGWKHESSYTGRRVPWER